jgi:hypothetical protein
LDPTGANYGSLYDGIPVYKLAATGPDNDNVTVITGTNPGEIQTCDVGGTNQASLTDYTSYLSTYTIDIVGEFGRAT